MSMMEDPSYVVAPSSDTIDQTLDEYGNVVSTEITPGGYTTDANGPGDSQGETNGLYGAVTINGVGTDGYAYMAANPGTRTDLLSTFRNAVSSIAGPAINNEALKIRARLNKQTQPTLSEQWAALTPFEKIGVISAVVGIIWVFSRKA